MEKADHWTWCWLALYALAWMGAPASPAPDEDVRAALTPPMASQGDLTQRR